jgi:hypothetical protein
MVPLESDFSLTAEVDAVVKPAGKVRGISCSVKNTDSYQECSIVAGNKFISVAFRTPLLHLLLQGLGVLYSV